MNYESRLYLIRHGEVEDRYHRVFGGRIDMNLSPVGREQAQKLASYLRHLQLDALYASPMIRAQQTLAPILEVPGRTAETLQGLREVDFGDWTSLGWQQVMDRYQISAFDWLQAIRDGKIPNGENETVFRERVESCLRHILERSRGKQVAVVCHGGVIRMLLSLLLDIPLPKTAGFEIDYASMTMVDYRKGKTEMVLMNFTPWRDLMPGLV